MPTKIRLQRKGKKGKAFYHLVIADGRAPRDGKFIERLGTYNPNTNPATIEIDFDRSLYWVQVGAQPSDTARSILSREGVMFKDHLLRGVKKGAFSAEQAEEKFQAWVSEKASKLEQVTKNDELSEKELKKKRLEDERKVNEARAEALAKKLAKANAKDVAPAEEVTEEATEEAAEEQQDAPKAEAPEVEAPKAEAPEAEAPEADASEEAKKE